MIGFTGFTKKGKNQFFKNNWLEKIVKTVHLETTVNQFEFSDMKVCCFGDQIKYYQDPNWFIAIDGWGGCSDDECLMDTSAFLKILAHQLDRNDLKSLQIKGEFIIILYHKKNRTLKLVRDMIGVRHLFYTKKNDDFFFSSTIKPLLDLPFSFSPDLPVIRDYLLNGSSDVSPQATCFQGISQIEPGSILNLLSKFNIEKKWLRFEQKLLGLTSYREMIDAFSDIFQTAVKRRLRDVTGIFVSGGLDSSSIAAVAAGAGSSLYGVTFSSPPRTPGDEEYYLNKLQDHLKFPIKSIPFDVGGDLINSLSENIRFVEMPRADSLWRSYHLGCQWLQDKKVKVVLSGDWGDQVLLSRGYLVDLLRQNHFISYCTHVWNLKKWDQDGLTANWIRDSLKRYVHLFIPRKLKWLITKSRQAMASKLASPSYFSLDAFGSLKQMKTTPSTNCFQNDDLLGEIFSKYTCHCLEWHHKVGHQFGMQASFPFLDQDLIEFLSGAPPHLLAQGKSAKSLLRDSMIQLLPKEIHQRKDKGDYTDQENMIVARNLNQLIEYLSQSYAVALGLTQQNEIQSLKKMTFLENNALAAWELIDFLGLEIWLREFYSLNEK